MLKMESNHVILENFCMTQVRPDMDDIRPDMTHVRPDLNDIRPDVCARVL